ncbi:MAG: universal stress protein [Chloroflexi bacterium]|nr:universal stress protein [Chloroflexota bacterium]
MIAGPLANTNPPHELILVRLLEPGPITSGVSVLNRRLDEAGSELEVQREALASAGALVRVAALTSSRPELDLVRLAGESEVDLVVVDGHRPVLRSGPIGGAVGRVLSELACDVAIVLARGPSGIETGPTRPIVVPFGGAEHDWAALELAAGIAVGSAAPIRLLGVSRPDTEGGDPSRLLANASVVLQQLAGIVATSRVVHSVDGDLGAATADAGMVVAGLSERWQREGLGAARSGLLDAARAPVVFVRRGTRGGLLAPPDNLTRFTWSIIPGAAAPSEDATRDAAATPSAPG